MRVTMHNGRGSAAHNDRNFDTGIAEHIDPEASKDNTIIRYQKRTRFDTSLQDGEIRYYREYLQDGLEARNRRYRAQRHEERTQTLEEYYKAPRSAPEETILQVGTRDSSVDAETLERIIRDQIAWEQATYPQVRYLSASIHVDEPGAAPHAHLRRVWIGHDRDGYEVVSQASALREMHVSRPDPDKPESRYNNSKIAHTAACRQHLQELCREYGIEIETAPRAPGRSGRRLEELKAQTAQRAARSAQRAAQRAQKDAQAAQDAEQQARSAAVKLERKAGDLKNRIHDLEHQAENAKIELYGLRWAIRQESTRSDKKRHRHAKQEQER